MIGQHKLKDTISKQIQDDTFPNFSILVGPRGSGKKLMCTYIAHQLKAYPVNVGTSVEEIRGLVKMANTMSTKVLFMIQDADSMSVAAKNALLKVTEETPNDAYIVMTLESESNTLDTIRSRGVIYRLDSYTRQELADYLNLSYIGARNHGKDLMLRIASTPGDIDKLVGINIVEFINYVTKVVDNISLVSGSNVFKIANNIALKETATGYDLRLFWMAFTAVCGDRLSTNLQRYADGILITSEYLQDLRLTGINKQMLFDAWLLNIRKAWLQWN